MVELAAANPLSGGGATTNCGRSVFLVSNSLIVKGEGLSENKH